MYGKLIGASSNPKGHFFLKDPHEFCPLLQVAAASLDYLSEPPKQTVRQPPLTGERTKD